MKTKHAGPHRYVRAKNKSSSTKMFKCGIEGCTFTAYEGIMEGREGQCWRCRKVFTVTRRSLRNKFLHCQDCTYIKNTTEIAGSDSVDLLIGELMKPFGLETGSEE